MTDIENFMLGVCVHHLLSGAIEKGTEGAIGVVGMILCFFLYVDS